MNHHYVSQYTEELSVLLKCSDTNYVTLCERIKEAAHTSKKQDTKLALNSILNRCEKYNYVCKDHEL